MDERICSIEGCERGVLAKGWCRKHYKRAGRYGDPLGCPPARPAREPKLCLVEVCARNNYAYGYCSMHWRRLRKHGDPLVGAAVRQTKICAAPGCDMPPAGLNLCPMHRRRMRLYGELEPVFPEPKRRSRNVVPCSIDGCERQVAARGWCGTHYSRWKRHGTPERLRMPGEIVNGKRICAKCGEDVPVDTVTNSRCAPCWGEENRRRQHERRAWRTNPDGLVERFTREDVLHRDGYVCQLCSLPIDRSVEYPHPMSASLDHILPLARGGSHTMANCQAAHRICNSKKWAHIPSHLAITG